MSSHNRLKTAIENGILPAESIRAALGNLSTSAAEKLFGADSAPITPESLGAQFELDSCFETAWQLYGIVGIETPTVTNFDNIDKYLTRFTEMQNSGLAPAFVLAPDLSYTQTRDLFDQLAARQPNLLVRLPVNHWDKCESSGLYINPNFSDDISWDDATSYQHDYQLVFIVDYNRWTLSILPTAPVRPFIAPSQQDLVKKGIALPTPPQLLALHAERIFNNKPMIDVDVSSVTATVIVPPSNRFPTVSYSEDSKQLYIGSIINSVKINRAVVRSPEWF